MSYIHTEFFKVRTSEINYDKIIHPHSLIQLMQEASMQHTLGLKVSVWDLEEKNISWVLLKMEVNFFRLPGLGENIEIRTYPSGLEGYFTFRDYFVYDESARVCSNASSMWTLMDTESRKMIKIPGEFNSLVFKAENPLMKPMFKFAPLNVDEADYIVKVNYLHLDWNGHVNNAQLIKMIFESLDYRKYLENKLKKITIQFKAEATEGQKLMVRSEHVSINEIRHAITNTDNGKDIVLATTIWNS